MLCRAFRRYQSILKGRDGLPQPVLKRLLSTEVFRSVELDVPVPGL